LSWQAIAYGIVSPDHLFVGLFRRRPFYIFFLIIYFFFHFCEGDKMFRGGRKKKSRNFFFRLEIFKVSDVGRAASSEKFVNEEVANAKLIEAQVADYFFIKKCGRFFGKMNKIVVTHSTIDYNF